MIKDEIVSLTKKLIKFESIESRPDQLKSVVDFVEDYLKKNTSLKLYRYESNGKPSLVGVFKKDHPSEKDNPYQTPEIIFHDHLDVVPGKPEQFKPFLKGTKLYGRGTADTKTHGAAMMVLAKELSRLFNARLPARQVQRSTSNVGFMFTTDEEVSGHDGTLYLLKKGWRPKFFVTLEPCAFEIIPAHKAVLWLKVLVKGKSSHASRPWKGINAGLKAYLGLEKLYKIYPLPRKEAWKTTINLGGIKGGDAFNKVMGECELKLDIRHIEKDKAAVIIKNVKKCFPRSLVEVVEEEPGMDTDFNNSYVKRLAEVVKKVTGQKTKIRRGHGACDGRFYSAVGIPSVEFGTVTSGLHTDNEYVETKYLESFYQILYQFSLDHSL